MKRALKIMLAVSLALPLAADEAKKADEKKAEPSVAQQQPAAQTDSPLVAAARRTNRLGKKSASPVITNESLKASKGHVTTSTILRPINVPEPELGPEGKLIQQKAQRAAEERKAREEAAAAAKKAAEQKAREAEAAAAAAEDGYDGSRDDADEFVGQENKPPQF
jgi:hypothetical protein